MRFVATDGGKQTDSPETENMDCTVRALAVAGCIPYEQAHSIAAKTGRKPNGPGRMVEILDQFGREHHGSYVWLPQGPHYPTVAQFVRRNPTGRFIVRVRSTGTRYMHVFVVINGAIYDNSPNSPRKRVRCAWQVVHGSSPAKQTTPHKTNSTTENRY